MILNIPRFLSFWQDVLAWHTSNFTNSSVRRKGPHSRVFTTSTEQEKRRLNLEPTPCMYWGRFFQLAAMANGHLVSSFPTVPVFWKIRQAIKGNKVLQTHLCCLHLLHQGQTIRCLETVYSTNVQEECVDIRVCWYCRIAVKNRGNSSCHIFMVLINLSTNSA